MFRTVEMSDPRLVRDGLHMITVRSEALGQRADVSVYVPTRLAAPAPLILLLHGVYGSHWCWALKGGAHLTAARMIAHGDLPPTVVAMPSDGLWGDGSGYVPHDRQDFERWIVEEVPAAVRLLAPQITETSRICIAGLSMGGFAALRLAAKFPKRFAAASALSALTELDQLRHFTTDDWTGLSFPAAEASLAALLPVAGAALPPIRFECGLQDAMLGGNRELDRRLAAAGVAHAYEEHEGGHDWGYWSSRLPATLAFFALALSR